MDSFKIQNVKVNYDRANLLDRIANRIRRSLELPEILSATAAEVQSFLGTDRVKIYKFHSDGSGEVIAESINDKRLPSLLGLHFPADDIPPHARELFAQVRVRSIVNIDSGLLGQSPRRDAVDGQQLPDEVLYKSIDPCHIEYLTAMGVKSSLAVPIFHGEEFWGLLVSHHSESRNVAEEELQGIQIVADQLGVAISQSTLLARSRAKAQREAALNRVAVALHSQPAIELQAALAESVAALDAVGGRLCIFKNRNVTDLIPYSDQSTQPITVYTCGLGPRMPISAKHQHLEQYSVWHEYFKSGEQVWAIPDLYKISSLRSLQPAFRSTKIRSILIVPLSNNQQLFGYLSIFREEFDTETVWAGQLDSDGRLAQSRISFEAWKESKIAQIREWNSEEIELSKYFGYLFAQTINQSQLYEEIEALNGNLENQVQQRTDELQKLTKQQRVLFEVVAKMRNSLNLENIFSTMCKEVRQTLSADRVGVYRFDPQSEFNDGEFVAEDIFADFLPAIGVRVNDHCFGDNYANLYSQGRVHALDDIQTAGLKDCFRIILEQFQIKATLVAPVMKGSELWGLLCVHQCSAPRKWESSEIQFVTQVSTQLSIALEQADLLSQTQQQAVDLQQVTEQQRILFEVVTKMRESLDINAIFKAATQEVCQFMEVDRIAVYRFNPDWSGKYVAEFVKEGWIKLVGEGINTVWENTYLQEHRGGRYLNNETLVVDDIYQACHLECNFTILERFQVQAYAIAPIFVGEEFWGLLAAYQHSGPRCWESSEVKFLAQIANQLGVAIQQANLLAQTRGQSARIAQNLKELQQTQAQLIQTEKMSGLGQLVAGIAHEINNPVNFIYGNLDHATNYTDNLLSLLEIYQQQYSDASPEIAELAEKIDLEFLVEDLPKLLLSMKVGADRIRQIVLSLRNFSRLDESQMKAVDIHEGIDSTLLILQHRLKSSSDSSANIVLVKEYGNLPRVECYAGQLNQVFMNIIGNAIDALESDNLSDRKSVNPQITISTAVGELNRNVPSAVIRIADNGCGISESTRQRIFDPFFTTKPVGKGTGLGLSISYQIVVEKHGGVLKCSSESGKGTEFAIEIPISHLSVDSSQLTVDS